MIRKMTSDDIFKVENLEKKIFSKTLGASFFDQELSLNPFALYYVLEHNKEIVAYIGLRVYDDVAEVLNFVVASNYQRQGLGQELFDYTLEILKKNKIETISLEVRKTNKQALNFYYKNDFYKDHVRKGYYDNNEDAYVLIKEVLK